MKSFRNYWKEDVTIEDADGKVYAEVIDIIKPEPIYVPQSIINYVDPVEESTRIRSQVGNVITVMLSWRGNSYRIKMFFPQVTKPTRKRVQDQIEKVYPGAKLRGYQVSDHAQGEPLLRVGGAGK